MIKAPVAPVNPVVPRNPDAPVAPVNPVAPDPVAPTKGQSQSMFVGWQLLF